MSWTVDTRIRDLPWRYPWMVIEELCALPLWQEGCAREEYAELRLGEAAALANEDFQDLNRRLEETFALATDDLEISCAELSQCLQAGTDVPVLLDVREPWEFATAHIAGSILLAEADFPALLASLKARPQQVVTVCHHGVRSFSAALFLRRQGVAFARSLTGGVELWATSVDLTMARY